jgi:molybdopterin converting factor small subunit
MERAYPELAPILRRAMIAVNTDYAGDDTVIPASAEVACIPPVSGG